MGILQKEGSNEGLSREKAKQFGRLFHPANNHAIAKVSAFHVINIHRINELLGTNFKGVILDFDECIAPHHGEIIEEYENAVIEMIKSGIRFVIDSNMEKTPRYDALIQRVLEETGYEIKVITSKYEKPYKENFEEARKALNLQEGEEAVMIGDNFCTDGGSIRAGIPFIKVEPVKATLKDKMRRKGQVATRGIQSGVSWVYDKVGGRRVLTDEDFL